MNLLEPGYVYFLSFGTNGLIKIGHTNTTQHKNVLANVPVEKTILIGFIKTVWYAELVKILHLFFIKFRKDQSKWFDMPVEYARKTIQTWDNMMDLDDEKEDEKCRRFVAMLKINFSS